MNEAELEIMRRVISFATAEAHKYCTKGKKHEMAYGEDEMRQIMALDRIYKREKEKLSS